MVPGSMEIDTDLPVVETQAWPMYTVQDWTTSLPQVEVWATQFYKVPWLLNPLKSKWPHALAGNSGLCMTFGVNKSCGHQL